MKRWMILTLLAVAAGAQAQTTPTKKDLVAKVLLLQQPAIEQLA